MFIKPTKELLQQIKDSGVPIIRLTMQEFLEISKKTGKILSSQEGINKIKNKKL